MGSPIEFAGLRVVENTLEPDIESTSELADVKGHLLIEVSETCILREEAQDGVALDLANRAVEETFDGGVVVEFWKLVRTARQIRLTAEDFKNPLAPKRRARTSEEFAERQRPVEGW